MVSTTLQGLELARVTVVGPDGATLYDSLCKPPHPVTDYHTQFSGITEEILAPVTTTLQDIQKELLDKFISPTTILIGHSLENDLKALRICHDLVVDTSILYPHKQGLIL